MNPNGAASEVLSEPSPIAGDPHEAYAAAATLAGVADRGDEFLQSVEVVQQGLAVNSSTAVTAIDTKLLVSTSHQALLLLSGARAGHSAFRIYGEQIERIHGLARATQTRAEELLAVIRVCGSQISQIGDAIGVPGSFAWHSNPPLTMPEPRIAWGVSVSSETVGYLPQDAERARALQYSFMWEWHTAAERWKAALEELGLLQTRWRVLQEERVDAEHRLAATLHATELGAGLVAGVGFGRGGGSQVPFGSVITAVSVTGRGAADHDPGTRRSHPLLVGLYRRNLADTLFGRQIPAPVVEDWWRALAVYQRQTLISEVPLVVGNLDGVPITARISANAVSAGSFARAEGISNEEANYWRGVAGGSTRLVVSDPDQSRIVEMVGRIGPETKRVVTYVPGTGAQMKHFYAGEVQQVSKYLVSRSSGETVAFVYKDGSWVSWAGKNSNTNYEFLGVLGERVAGFQSRVLDGDSALSGLPQVAVGHSAGMSVISGAEHDGAKFDQVISLGGAFMLPEWHPTPGTEYHHFQYENDLINRIDGGRLRTPHELTDVYAPHIFGAEGEAELESHSRIAQGPTTNGGALRELLRVTKESE